MKTNQTAGQQITQKPSFREIFPVAELADHLPCHVAALMEGLDTVQRATDLLGAAEQFRDEVQALMIVGYEPRSGPAIWSNLITERPSFLKASGLVVKAEHLFDLVGQVADSSPLLEEFGDSIHSLLWASEDFVDSVKELVLVPEDDEL